MKLSGKALEKARMLRVRRHFSPCKIANELRRDGIEVSAADVREALGLPPTELRPRARQLMAYIGRKRSITLNDAVLNLDIRPEHATASLRRLVERGLVRVDTIEGVEIYERAA